MKQDERELGHVSFRRTSGEGINRYDRPVMETDSCLACLGTPIGSSCEADFQTLLGWEHNRPSLLAVHHLTVLAYHLQHPHLYSPDGLVFAQRLLADFLVGLTPTAARARHGAGLDSGRRSWRVTGTPESYGVYAPRPQWTMTAGNVVTAGIDADLEQVPRWANTVQNSILRAK